MDIEGKSVRSQVASMLASCVIVVVLFLGHFITRQLVAQLGKLAGALCLLLMLGLSQGCASPPRQIQADQGQALSPQDHVALGAANLQEQHLEQIANLLEQQDLRQRVVELNRHQHANAATAILPSTTNVAPVQSPAASTTSRPSSRPVLPWDE